MIVPALGSRTRLMITLAKQAFWLFDVVTFGREITLALPWVSRAVMRASRAFEPSIDPSARSIAEPLPAPTVVAGKSAIKGMTAPGIPLPAGMFPARAGPALKAPPGAADEAGPVPGTMPELSGFAVPGAEPPPRLMLAGNSLPVEVPN